MPIVRRLATARLGVAWYLERPSLSADEAFTSRGLRTFPARDDSLVDDATFASDAFIAGLAAAVIIQTATKLSSPAKFLTTHAERLLDHGCEVIIVAFNTPERDGVSLIDRAIESKGLPARKLTGEEPSELEPARPYVRVYPANVDWSEVANDLLKYPGGGAPNRTTRVVGSPIDDEQIRLLLQRAFADCESVDLVRNAEGKSGASVYCGFAELQPLGELPTWPMPHFIKIGERQSIEREYENYKTYVAPYVPFHLGPHLDAERCNLGAHYGVLVGNHVEEAEALLNCAKAGRAGPAISCLFDRTLRGWYRAGRVEAIALRSGVLLPTKVEIDPARWRKIEQLGATKVPDELAVILDNLAPAKSTLIGLVHGDLHANNILVRGNDAILIDFGRQSRAPILIDPASLEVSLLIDGAIRHNVDDQRNWFESIHPLYAQFSMDPPISRPSDTWAWLHSCVRQIRLYARRFEYGSNQYAAALVAALVLKAKRDPEAPLAESSIRAAAYVLAERLLIGLQSGVNGAN
jgi:uncharacterized protein associated with vWA-MoxR-VMAP ternary system